MKKRYLLAVSILGLAVVVWNVTRTATAPRIEVRVMTFNIRYDNHEDGQDSWDNRKDFVSDILRQEAPDVVGLQETNPHQLDALKAALPEYSAVGMGRDGGNEGEYCAILYKSDRFEVAESETFWLSETPNKPSVSWSSSCPRICTWVRLTEKASNRSFYVYNTHLDHQSQEAKVMGVRLIMAHMENRSHRDPVLLMGDFNAEENHDVIAFLKGLSSPDTPKEPLVDSFRAHHPDEKTVGTYHGFKGNVDGRKIDYIFASQDVHTLDSAILRTHRNGRYPSDHFPVTAHFQFDYKR